MRLLSRFRAFLAGCALSLAACQGCGDSNTDATDTGAESAYTPESGETPEPETPNVDPYASLPSSPCGPKSALVTRTLDGDTIEIAIGEGKEKIRMILVDTPEISHNSKEVAECFGPEAQAFTAGRVGGGEVMVGLTYDTDCRDFYGRLLAFVHVADQGNSELSVLNEELLAGGFATVLYISPDGKSEVDRYRAIAAEAKSALVGGYGACAKFNP